MYESNVSKCEVSSPNSSENVIPDFIKNEKIDDALKNVFQQEIQIYLSSQQQEGKSERSNQILAFPALMSSRSRFILHTMVSSNFPQLLTFSIGEEPSRRCYVSTRDIFPTNYRYV